MSATIIDTLIVKLGLDSKDLTSKGGSASKTLKGLESSGKSASASIDGLTRSVGSFLAVLGGTVALKAFVENTIASSAALDRLSKNLGINVQELSAWGNAVEEMGGSAKGLQGTLSMLSAAQTELQYTGTSALIPYFNTLGIAVADAGGKVRPVNDLLLDIAERFQHLDRPTANNLGKMMGIDQDTLNLLLQGRREVEAMISRQKQFNAVSKAQAEESAKLQRSIIGLKQSFTALGRDLLQQASPAIEKMLSVLSGLANWVQNNKEFIKDLAVILGTVAAGLTAISIASSPITLTVVAIGLLAAAIAALWQDYQNWKRGGDSFIDWEKWKPGINSATAAIKDLAKVVKESFGAIFDDVQAVQKLMNGDWRGALGSARKSDDKVRAAVADAWHGITGVAGGAAATAGRLTNKNPNVSSAYAMQYFQDRGLSKVEAAALASQIHSESNGNSKATGDNGKAFGLIQWHADRQANFAKMFGHSIQKSTNPDEQLAFILHELQSTERGAGRKLAGDTDAYQAGSDASRLYVRPADKEGEAAKRGNYAAQLLGIQGASATARAAGSKGNSSTSTSTDNSVKVDIGSMTIQTAATSADGIASHIVKSVNNQFTAQANGGLN